MTDSVKLTEETFVLYPNKQHAIGSPEVGSLLHIVSKEIQRSKKLLHLEICSLFTEKLCALENKFDFKFDETRQILMTFDLKSEKNQKKILIV